MAIAVYWYLWAAVSVSVSFCGHSPPCVHVTRNLTTIDESGSILSASDISFDKTEEDFDGDVRAPRGAKRPLVPLAASDDDADNDVLPSGKRSRRPAVGICVECFL